MPNRSYRIFLSAGEASGDHYGAQLMQSLHPFLPDAIYTGLGGTEMSAAGQKRVIRAEDVAVMGITEIIRHIPRILRSYRKLVASIKANPPDVAILIDFPDVNFRLARHLHRMGIPVLWFVSPQLWAWKRRRLRWVQKRVSTMFVIFPFELSFYRNRGVDAQYVGHPLADLPRPSISREQYAEAARHLQQEQWNHSDGLLQSNPLPAWAVSHGPRGINYPLDPAKPWIALLPGSRRSEIRKNLRDMVEAAILLGPGYEYLIPVAPTIQPDFLRLMQYETGNLLTGANPPRITFVRDARAALTHARASVVASGTATVQAALIGNPFIIVYKVSDLTFRLAKSLIRYPAEISTPADRFGNLPIGMPNLIAGSRIIPELINKQFTASHIIRELKPLLEDSPARRTQIDTLAKLAAGLKLDPHQTAISHLRNAVLSSLGQSSSASTTIASNKT